ncbi:hypothetical protein TELCIR_13542 [Teladorsagia circumcincta]|uniref:Uncharacterized protein n=1 Tax=Teladorsagia circumcincta TaxID=45464 RepID=A0A2G9U3P9_TELCI|nr:hypothetical protein TELCIR_13542 [Teladorsagia circumcincta]
MGKEPKVKDVIEFPDSTVNVNLKFDEKDMRLLDESETTETILLNAIARLKPACGGLLTLILMPFLYEWQRLHASKLTRNSRASFNYAELLALDKNYIPYYTMGYLFGEKYKGFILPCTGDLNDDRTPNE